MKVNNTQWMMNEVEEYIKRYEPEVQQKLQEIRAIIREVIPSAEEVISYGIPTFRVNKKNVVHFGGWKKHIGFYPGASGVKEFEKELSKYEGAKGSVKFPLKEPLPTVLIQEIVKYRLAENQKK